jgi:3-isopropylmalate/(R)-2-methylmalate dehydratase large subunit
MAAKILARAAGLARVEVGDAVAARTTLVTLIDSSTFIDRFREEGTRVWDPERVIFCFDHIYQPEWMPTTQAKEHPKIRAFAAEQGIPVENIFDLGRNGISHQIPVEKGYALPGTVSLGIDTQIATMGAVNCFALPLGHGVDPVLLSGDLWMIVPESVRIDLSGALPPGVTGKDLVYQLIRDLGPEVQGCVLEFSGPGIASLSIDARMAICNGSMQIGAMTAIFPADAVLLDYERDRAREPFEPVAPDADARYAATYAIDLSTVERLVAGPHDIEKVRPLSAVAGLEVNAAYIGSCSSGRISDLALAARVLRGRKVHPGVRLVITPISADTQLAAAQSDVLATLLAAGATVTQPGCGACYHSNLSPLKLGDGDRCISSSVETLRGRMGSLESEVLLANAAVVAASAIEGRIADPAPYLAREAEPAAA